MSALLFDGVNDYATFPFFQDPQDGAWTFVIVFRSDTANRFIFSQFGSINSAPWLRHEAAGLRAFPASSGPAVGISTGVWYMGALRRNTATGNLTINAIRTGSNSQASASVPTLPTILDGAHWIGLDGAGTFSGIVAYQLHYSRFLADAEMTTLFSGVREILEPRGISL